MNRSWLGFFATAITLLLVAGCNLPPPPPVDATPPTVVSTDPTDGASDVPINASIQVTFSEPMDQSATQVALSFDPNVSCNLSWDPTGTILSCNPTTNLITDTAYNVTVDTGAQDLAGNPLQATFTFGFTTGNIALATCIFDDSNSHFDGCVFGN